MLFFPLLGIRQRMLILSNHGELNILRPQCFCWTMEHSDLVEKEYPLLPVRLSSCLRKSRGRLCRSDTSMHTLAAHSAQSWGSVSPFRTNTFSSLSNQRTPSFKSVSKERTLTPFRMNTYEKQGKRTQFALFWCNVSPFQITTSKSLSKQSTLTSFRMNTY